MIDKIKGIEVSYNTYVYPLELMLGPRGFNSVTSTLPQFAQREVRSRDP